MKKLWILLIGFLFVLSLSGCTSNIDTTVRSDKAKVVKIGVIAPLSGPAANYGEDEVSLIKDSLKEFKDKNPNLKVDIIVEDGKCNGKDAVGAVQKLINVDNVDVILGGACSSETLSAGKIANANKVTMISAISSAPSVSNLGEYIFRFWNDAHASIVLANYINNKYKSVAIITENTDYAMGISNKFKDLYKGSVMLDEKFMSDEKDLSIFAKRIVNRQDTIDAILVFTQDGETAIGVIKSFDAEGLIDKYGKNIIGAYFFTDKQFLDTIGDVGNGMVEVNIDKTSYGEKGQIFIKDYTINHDIKGSDFFLVLEKEAIELIFEAIEKGYNTSDGFKSYFAKINKSNPRKGSYFGNYYFDDKGDAIGLNYIMQQLVDGKPVILN